MQYEAGSDEDTYGRVGEEDGTENCYPSGGCPNFLQRDSDREIECTGKASVGLEEQSLG